MPYVDVLGHSTFYEQRGSGEPVLMLHGGFCSNEMMRERADALADRFSVMLPERPGHGRTADQDGPMSYARSVDDTLAFMDAMGVDAVHAVGFSDGAIIGMLLALQHPQRLRSLVAISGNLTPEGVQVSGEQAGETASDGEEEEPVDETWERLRADYDRLSPDGADHADVVIEKIFRMWGSEPDIDPASLGAVTRPTLVMAGDRDLIRPEHTRLIADSIPDAQLCIVPGASHLLLQERPALIDLVLGEFLDAVSQPTLTRGSSTP